jgi:2-(1,2-epoxy-1,2-dihydrophenyl)acetyl-CoA isomerase
MEGGERMRYLDLVEEARAVGGELVVVERPVDGAAVVRLSDPEKLNVLSAALTLQLQDALASLVVDPGVRTIVLTGADPAFSAGGDLRMMARDGQAMIREGEGGTTELWRWIRERFGGIVRTIVRTDKAFVAAVNGAAAGVGLAFALACDVIIVSDRARIVPAFGRIGLLPEVGTSWLLTRRLGYQRTFGLFAAGEHLSGAEAFEAGLANELVPHDDLMPAALRWAERVNALPPHVVPMMKPQLRAAADMTWDHALAMEEFAEPSTFTTAAHREAVAELLGR